MSKSKASGFASRFGLHSDRAMDAIESILERATALKLETIRISFVDQHGMLRGKVIVATDLANALENGVMITSTLLLKDTSHTTVFPVWTDDAGFGKGQMTGASDLVMLPDPNTFKVLPWSEKSGWMLSNLYFTDGNAHGLSTRNILRRAIAGLHQRNLDFICGLEVEFYVYRLDNPNLAHEDAGKPEAPPETSLLSHGYQYLTEQNYDQIEPVMNLVRYNAERLELPIRSMEAEYGPSQFEITFHPGGALESADNMVLFRSMVKQVCKRAGYHATFMCRPNLPNAMGNGWHLHQSVVDLESRKNVFATSGENQLSPVCAQWIAGLLAHAGPGCLLTTPTINGYKRYQPFALAPDRIQWGRDNRGAMVRALCGPGQASRIENRVGESAANPNLYIASQILSGMDGIEKNMVLPDAVEAPYQEDAKKLPDSLIEALRLFEKSEFYRDALGEEFVDYYCQIKRHEWNRFIRTVSDWEHREYFSLF